MPRMKLIMSIYSGIRNMSSSKVHRPLSWELRVEWTGIVTRPTSSFMSTVITVASPDCHDLHFTHTSAWHRAWIGYCVVWLRNLARPVNMLCFLFTRQIWEGCGWERTLQLVMQSVMGIRPGGMIEAGRKFFRRVIYDDFCPSLSILGVVVCRWA